MEEEPLEHRVIMQEKTVGLEEAQPLTQVLLVDQEHLDKVTMEVTALQTTELVEEAVHQRLGEMGIR